MKQIRKTSLKPLWETERYDGIISGFAMYRGRPVYFRCPCLDEEYERPVCCRRFVVYPVSEAAWLKAVEVHDDFTMWVSDSSIPNWCRELGKNKPIETHCLFYEKWKGRNQDVSYDNGSAIGYFWEYDERIMRKAKRGERSFRLYRIEQHRHLTDTINLKVK